MKPENGDWLLSLAAASPVVFLLLLPDWMRRMFLLLNNFDPVLGKLEMTLPGMLKFTSQSGLKLAFSLVHGSEFILKIHGLQLVKSLFLQHIISPVVSLSLAFGTKGSDLTPIWKISSSHWMRITSSLADVPD